WGRGGGRWRAPVERCGEPRGGGWEKRWRRVGEALEEGGRRAPTTWWGGPERTRTPAHRAGVLRGSVSTWCRPVGRSGGAGGSRRGGAGAVAPCGQKPESSPARFSQQIGRAACR